jgi:hypothetical protein
MPAVFFITHPDVAIDPREARWSNRGFAPQQPALPPAGYETVEPAKAVIASKAEQSRGGRAHPGRDCFVACGASQ